MISFTVIFEKFLWRMAFLGKEPVPFLFLMTFPHSSNDHLRNIEHRLYLNDLIMSVFHEKANRQF